MLQFTLFLLIGVGLFVFYGQHPAGVRELGIEFFRRLLCSEMPRGVAGLLVAAILAAAMSNLSAALNSLSSTTVVDFWMRWRPEAETGSAVLVSRSSTVFWAVVLFGMAVYSVGVGGKGHVVEIGLSIASVAYGALLGVFLLGTLTASDAGRSDCGDDRGFCVECAAVAASGGDCARSGHDSARGLYVVCADWGCGDVCGGVAWRVCLFSGGAEQRVSAMTAVLLLVVVGIGLERRAQTHHGTLTVRRLRPVATDFAAVGIG